MSNLSTLFSKYDRLVLFDTETTGLQYNRDEIIEFAAVVVEQVNGVPTVIREYDELVSLSPGGFVPPKIEQLTGISTQDIRERGLPKTRVCRDIAEMIQGNTLLLAYNAHFGRSGGGLEKSVRSDGQYPEAGGGLSEAHQQDRRRGIAKGE